MLYKYTTFKRLKEILEKGKLHFSSPFQLNDFYEGWGTIKWRGKNTSFDARHGIWILSLSRTWNNIVMWSHYAESNEGVCIGFNEDNLKFCIGGEWNHLNVYNVNYQSDLPQVQPSGDIVNDDKEDIELKNFWSTKGESWEYEEESRIFLSVKDFEKFKEFKVPCDWIDDNCKSCCCKFNQSEFDMFNGLYNGGLNIDFCKNSLEEIIFGLKVENSKIDEIKKIISNKVKFSQIKASSGSYQFEKGYLVI